MKWCFGFRKVRGTSYQCRDEMSPSLNRQMESLLQNSLFHVKDDGEHLNLLNGSTGQNTVRPLKVKCIGTLKSIGKYTGVGVSRFPGDLFDSLGMNRK